MDEAPMGNSFVFDPNDDNQIAEMIRNHAAYPRDILAASESGEPQTIAVSDDKITVWTLQDNGWTRVNTYWQDGTREETYTRDKKER